ncbi:MAG: hypothetical protein AAB091_05105 [Elusimicrobiota bacterium]
MDQNLDSLLARKIVEDLCKEDLLTAKQLDELAEKLESGRLKAEDWQLILEVAVDVEKAKKNA